MLFAQETLYDREASEIIDSHEKSHFSRQKRDSTNRMLTRAWRFAPSSSLVGSDAWQALAAALVFRVCGAAGAPVWCYSL